MVLTNSLPHHLKLLLEEVAVGVDEGEGVPAFGGKEFHLVDEGGFAQVLVIQVPVDGGFCFAVGCFEYHAAKLAVQAPWNEHLPGLFGVDHLHSCFVA